MNGPTASRPHMPEYGLRDAQAGQGLLPWSWAVERLENNRSYWLATVRPDGRPHAVAVWGIWLDDTLCFSTGPHSRKAHNLAKNARCVVCTERADEAVIVEGVAEILGDSLVVERVAELYMAKYQMIYPSDSSIYRVWPTIVFGFIEQADSFADSATRWHFT